MGDRQNLDTRKVFLRHFYLVAKAYWIKNLKNIEELLHTLPTRLAPNRYIIVKFL